jgi:PAS domain S-box-containing protein
MLGYQREELTDKHFHEITHPEDLDKELEQLNRLLEGKDESYTMEKRYYYKNGDIIWTILSVSIVRDRKGKPLHFVSQVQDISERKEYEQEMNRSLEEKRVLLEEIHHRVKNNLASVSGILELQIYNTEYEEVKEGMQDAQARIYTMALVHEQLYQHDSLSNIMLGEYAEQLMETIHDSLNNRNKDIQTHIEAEEVQLDITKAVPCGLILNELITNIYKHGFKGPETGNIWITIKQSDQKVRVCVADDGVGLPDDFSLEDQDTLGINLINTLLDQLDAEMHYKNDDGAQFEFVFSRLE